MSGLPIISLMTITPLLGAVWIWLQGSRQDASAATRVGLRFTAVTFAWAALVGWQFSAETSGLQLVEQGEWVPTLNLSYHVGVDGLSLLMIWLTTLLIPVSLLAARPRNASHHFVALILLLETGLLGTFTAMNFFHWFLFWEISLIPAFFLVRLWGGPKSAEASVQFFVYTFVGSVGLLLSFLALFAASGTFEFAQLAEQARSGALFASIATYLGWEDIPIKWIGVILFSLAFLGVAVKVPLYPFHTWLPSTYAEAPTGITLLLTGLMSKMGVYALLRLIVPVFGAQMQLLASPLLGLAALTIIASAFAAYQQRDLKRIFAYSSINHLGYCFLGVFAIMQSQDLDAVWVSHSGAALNGVILQMFQHGIIAGLIFFLIAQLESRSDGLRDRDDFGGLRSVVPVYSTSLGIALFASLGLPGLSAFIGEFLIFKGAFGLTKWAPALSTIGLLITAVFILGVIQKLLTGPMNKKWDSMPDLQAREKWVVYPAIALILIFGIFPQLLIHVINPTTLQFLAALGGGQ